MQSSTIALFAIILTGSWVDQESPKPAPQDIQGKWVAVQGEMAGKPLPEALLKSIQLTIEGTQYLVQAESPDKGEIKLGTHKSHQTMDIVGKEGPNKGKTLLAIYKTEKGKLTICYDLEGKARPSEFVTKPGSKHFLVVYEKTKE